MIVLFQCSLSRKRAIPHFLYLYENPIDLSFELNYDYTVGIRQCDKFHLGTLLMLPLYFPGPK